MFFKTQNTSVGYKTKIVVDNINISLERGKILSIIGPNGGGKSTIIKSIARHIKPIYGNIYISNRDISDMPVSDISKKLSVVFTQKPYAEKYTCEDIVSMGRYPYTGKFGFLSENDKAKVKEAMNVINIFNLKNKYFNEISDGQKQRVLLACALCQEPELILLDEPSTFLDIKYKIELLSILNDMARNKNISIILTIHELDLAEKLSDYVICVKNGCVDKYGTPDDIFKEDYINYLFDIEHGSYNSYFGRVEMTKNTKKPKVFVIAGNGSGTNVFKSLNKNKIPFAAGVLHKNDIDCVLAKYTASAVVYENAFENIGDDKIECAKNIIRDCEKVICCLKNFGAINYKNKELIDYAERIDIKVERY